MSLKIAAHGKLNLTLYITGCRADGYHTLHTVMQSVSLADVVTINQTTNNTCLVTCSVEQLCDENNLAYKATQLFCSALNVTDGFHIHIEKNIPIAGGMGGGSADGAAVLFGLNYWYDNPFTTEQLCEMALQLGADVPFCLVGGTQLATGIGEVLSPLPDLPDCGIVLLKPCKKESTGEMYAKYDKIKGLSTKEKCGIINGIERKDIKKIASCLENEFQPLYDDPAIEQAISRLMQQGALSACLTGSGPMVFGVFETVDLAERASEQLSLAYPSCVIAVPVNCGCELLG